MQTVLHATFVKLEVTLIKTKPVRYALTRLTNRLPARVHAFHAEVPMSLD